MAGIITVTFSAGAHGDWQIKRVSSVAGEGLAASTSRKAAAMTGFGQGRKSVEAGQCRRSKGP